MDKATIKSFINWLETASLEQIMERQESARKTLAILSSSDARSDVKLALRLIDEELIARLQLQKQA